MTRFIDFLLRDWRYENGRWARRASRFSFENDRSLDWKRGWDDENERLYGSGS